MTGRLRVSRTARCLSAPISTTPRALPVRVTTSTCSTVFSPTCATRSRARERKDRPMKVLIIGSGPITIGQAAEVDYAGSQACRALREEGIETVLVNSNPATIMTDPGVADITYIEPLTVEVLERIIAKERPDGLLPTLGGQTGLKLAAALGEAGRHAS